MIRVYVEKQVSFLFKYKRLFKKITSYVLDYLSVDGTSEVNLIIANNDQIQELYKKYKNKDRPTDVLSFETDWKNLAKIIGYNMLGDIYISYEKVKEQAISYNHSLKREWCYLFTHGLLHLCGFDHQTPEEEQKMNDIANHIMEKIKVGRDA